MADHYDPGESRAERAPSFLSTFTRCRDWGSTCVSARIGRGHLTRSARHAPANCCGTQEERMNWLARIASVTLFGLRTVPERKGAALAATVGIAGVVIVLVGVLSIAEGFRA